MKRMKRLKKKNNKGIFFIKTIQIICIIIMIFSGIKIFRWWVDNTKSKEVLKKINKNVTYNENGENYRINFNTLIEQNSDTVAWIKVKGTKIEYPVVKYTDNDYYLTHSFDRSENEAGWIYLDYRNKLDDTDKNIIIYGHNRQDGSMFGTLKNILEEKWYNNEENKYVLLNTENESIKYEVFSVYTIKKESYYLTTDFEDGEFTEFIKRIKSRSIKDFNVTVTSLDQILTLSTCDNKRGYRVVLHAKKVI